jgi:hypothetical protein
MLQVVSFSRVYLPELCVFLNFFMHATRLTYPTLFGLIVHIIVKAYYRLCLSLRAALLYWFFTVGLFHCMFRPTWPSSGVTRLIFEEAAFCLCGHTLHVPHLCFVPVFFLPVHFFACFSLDAKI